MFKKRESTSNERQGLRENKSIGKINNVPKHNIALRSHKWWKRNP
jgi:hypothetical protein